MNNRTFNVVVFPNGEIRYETSLVNWLLVIAIWKQTKRRKEKVMFT